MKTNKLNYIVFFIICLVVAYAVGARTFHPASVDVYITTDKTIADCIGQGGFLEINSYDDGSWHQTCKDKNNDIIFSYYLRK